MSRPHEDRERHTLVDHRTGGPAIRFSTGSWWAIAIANVAAQRVDAEIASFESLIEKAQTSGPHAHSAVVFRSANDRRVLALVELDGHEAYRRLAAAWDDHHVFAEHRANAESRTLRLHRVAETFGESVLDPGTQSACSFEHIGKADVALDGLHKPLAAASGFRGAIALTSDDPVGTALIYQFEHTAEIATFRESSVALATLGAVGDSGEALFALRPIKTLAGR